MFCMPWLVTVMVRDCASASDPLLALPRVVPVHMDELKLESSKVSEDAHVFRMTVVPVGEAVRV